MSKAKICRMPADFSPLAMLEPASPKPTKPMVRSGFMMTRKRELFEFVDVADAKFRKFRAKTIKVHAQLARLQSLARLELLGEPVFGKLRHFSGILSLNDDYAVGVGDDDVSSAN